MNRSTVLVLGVGIALFFAAHTAAQEAEEIKSKITTHEQKIQELETEIAAYEKELTAIDTEKRTLESTVREIDISRKKVSANIQVEMKKIETLEKEIDRLDTNIADAETHINSLKQSLAALLTHMHELEEQSMIESFLHNESLQSVWDEISDVEQINFNVQARVDELDLRRTSLTETRKESDARRAERIAHQNTLVAEKRGLDITQREKNNLLKTTKQTESSYQKLLAEKRAAKEEFEAALRSLESELSFTFDPSRIPSAGKGILAWPLANVFITQKFGDTAFAKSGAYNGKGHNGIDFRASLGTPVFASLSGTVIGTGNTDIYRGCYSYGKWVLIRHANGLSTLYAHLSYIAVSEGAAVSTGDVIGNSGNTGYSTGPHLHYGVYVSDAVQLKRLGDVKQKTACANAVIPVAPLNAYLDPLEYL
ncbi:MAG: peptidoglycan DD-metalloendopeptidase family protein [Parcubacteria group bacterium]|nr:peptidoglycan DD-metalloendopeptidase family protein [Parcubacteria group bacterium]